MCKIDMQYERYSYSVEKYRNKWAIYEDDSNACCRSIAVNEVFTPLDDFDSEEEALDYIKNNIGTFRLL